MIVAVPAAISSADKVRVSSNPPLIVMAVTAVPAGHLKVTVLEVISSSVTASRICSASVLKKTPVHLDSDIFSPTALIRAEYLVSPSNPVMVYGLSVTSL